MAKTNVDFDFSEFVFDATVIHDLLTEGTKELQKETKQNLDRWLPINEGFGSSGRYFRKDPAGSISTSMKHKINSAKKEGVITFEGYQHLKQKRPVRNAEVAFLTEYGAPRRGFNSPRPFMWKTVTEFRSDLLAQKYLNNMIK